jgi:hypothetical protein
VKPSAPRRPDQRRHGRAPTKVYADLYWEGAEGRTSFARAYCLDISEGGLRLRLPSTDLKPGVSVNVRIEAFGFAEYGIVRYVHGHGIVGIEFRFEAADKMQIERWQKVVRSARGKAVVPAAGLEPAT